MKLVKSAELLRKLKRVARRRGESLTAEPGKGSHMKVSLGPGHTVIPMHGTEIGVGLLKAILRDLGLREEDL